MCIVSTFSYPNVATVHCEEPVHEFALSRLSADGQRLAVLRAACAVAEGAAVATDASSSCPSVAAARACRARWAACTPAPWCGSSRHSTEGLRTAAAWPYHETVARCLSWAAALAPKPMTCSVCTTCATERPSAPSQFRATVKCGLHLTIFEFLAHWRSGVKVLAQCLDVQGVIHCAGARGACADDQCVFVAVSAADTDEIVVISRDTGAMRRRFGRRGVGYGDLLLPRRTCFVSRNRRIAVANSGHDRVSVFSVDGVFVRNVGVGMLRHPMSVACSAGGDELVVADYGHCRLVVFSASDELLHVVRDGQFTSVAIHGSTVFALTSSGFGSTFVAVE